MLYNNLALYEKKYRIKVNEIGDTLFYDFDYDERTSALNMEFQHFHTFYEMCIVLCPTAIHLLEGKPYDLREFDMVIIPPNVLHRTQWMTGEPSKRVIVQFNLPTGMPGLSKECDALVKFFDRDVSIFRFNGELRKRIYRKINDIFLLAPNTDPMRNMNIHVKFLEFLTLLYANEKQNEYRNEKDMSPVEEKIFSITGYIHTHYADDLSLESLSKEFFISSCYLSHQFKDLTGFTLTDYIQMTRVRNVQNLLINTDIPITDAALQCGFTSFSQFNRVFQKHIHKSPSQFRKEYQGAGSVIDL